MIRTALAVLLAAVPLAGAAQTDFEVETLPVEIANVVRADGRLVERILTWEVDLTGDAQPDQMVQVAYALGSGNAVVLEHYLFEGRSRGYALVARPRLPNGIKAVRRTGNGIEVTVLKYLDGDGRCCPSGQHVVMVRP